jgi:hypothetical protein
MYRAQNTVHFKDRDQWESRGVWKASNVQNSSQTVLINFLFFFLILTPSCNKSTALLQLIKQAMACWIGNVLLTVSRTSPFWIFMCMQYHYFSRFANHVGRCCLLLLSHAVQPISGSSVWYLANRKPSLPHLPSPALKNYCNCEKMCQYFIHQTT